MSSNDRWKYRAVIIGIGLTAKSTNEKVQAELDRQASGGWELTAMTSIMHGLQLVFRRPA